MTLVCLDGPGEMIRVLIIGKEKQKRKKPREEAV